MKKLFIFAFVVLAVISLAACGKSGNGPTLPTNPSTPGEIDTEATYRLFISDTRSMNPYSETLANATTLNTFLTAGLYLGDYDWETAIAEGIATEVGDFTNSAQLPYYRFPNLAKSFPIDISEEGRPGTKWRIELRDDIYFEDGTPITAQTYSYSWSMLLDPKLLNARANNLYDAGNLPLVRAEAYFRQGNPISGTDPVEVYPEVSWDEVGFKVIDDQTFEIELTIRKTEWQVMGQLVSGITGVVHPAAYEAGMNEDRTRTSYGTIENPLVSYGSYKLATWEEDTVFIFTRNDAFPHADLYRIKNVRYDVINDQSLAISEFRAGRLDQVGIAGQYFSEFRDNPTMRLTPQTAFGRFAFNIGERPGRGKNAILQYEEFRYAFYHAIDRETFANEVRMPSFPNQAFIGPSYLPTETSSVSYRESEQGKDLLKDLFPQTYGYNPNRAKELFDVAYNQAVADGIINDGDIVSVEFTFFDAETNWSIANWVRDTVQEIFKDAGVNRPKFLLELRAVSGDALDSAWDSKDFDMTLGFWQGMDFWPALLMGYVYNSTPPWDSFYMLEAGFDTGNAEMAINLDYTKAQVEIWIAQLNAITGRELSKDEEDYLKIFNDFLIGFEDGLYITTFNDAFATLLTAIMDYEMDFPGRENDMLNITAAMEKVLIDQMIAVPLFTATAATVFSSRMIIEPQDYHVWMGWGDFRYRYISK